MCEEWGLYTGSNLLCFPELLNDLCSHLVVFQEVIGDGVSDPGGPLSWTQLQQLVPCLLQKNRHKQGLFIHADHQNNRVTGEHMSSV